MKVYKYDYITMVSVKEDTKKKLLDLKYKYHFKSINELIEKMILEFEYQNEEPYDKYNS